MLPESDHLSCFCPREVSPNLSRPFCSLSLDLMSRPSRKSSQVLIQNRRSSLPDHRDPLVFSRRVVEDLRVVSYALPLYSYLSFEYLEVVSRAMKTSSPAIGRYWLLEDGYYTCISLILRCRSVVYCSRLHFI
jgi:hypothetical protein